MPKFRPKGTLPVPRQIFPRSRPDKHDEAFAKRATPSRSRPESVPEGPTAPLAIFKSQMSAIRKRHLTEGLKELSLRERTIKQQINERSQFKLDERARLLSQNDRDDDRLTGVTVVREMQPGQEGVQSLAEAEARALRKRNNAEAHQRAKEEERQEALQALYVNSQDFIITEKQLDDEIEREFGSKFSNAARHGLNIWNKGPQDTIDELLRWHEATISSNPKTKVSRYAPEKTATTTYEDRLKRIGEELTGGKIPDKKTPDSGPGSPMFP